MSQNFKLITDLRYERKFVLNTDDIQESVLIVKTNLGLFKEMYEERQINSVYFDTFGFEYYSDNAFGKSDRHKVRVRWYGDEVDKMKSPKIEIKSKNGHLGSKDIYELSNMETDDFIKNHKKFILNSEIGKAEKELFLLLNPVILISYSRRYFISADKTFRITLDYNLKYYNLLTGFNPYKKIDTNLNILELKYKFRDDERARVISSRLPYRYSKSSKYAIGLELVN